MSIPLFIVISYIVILFLISFWAEKRSRGGVDNFVLAGRQLTTPLVTVSIVGLAIGGASTIGVAEQAYRVGLSAGWYTAAWGIGAIVMGLTVAKKYRQLNITTVPELLERYYDRRSMIAGIGCQVLVQLVIMSLQYVAGGAILAALLPTAIALEWPIGEGVNEIKTIVNEEHTLIMTREVSIDDGIKAMEERAAEFIKK